jgi:galactokinase
VIVRAEAYAPGRVELLGNHTDYNGGIVLGAAIDRGLKFGVSNKHVGASTTGTAALPKARAALDETRQT